jgi:hypothetical protein
MSSCCAVKPTIISITGWAKESRSSAVPVPTSARNRYGSQDPTSGGLGTWRIHLTQLLLKRQFGFKLGELYRQTADALW